MSKLNPIVRVPTSIRHASFLLCFKCFILPYYITYTVFCMRGWGSKGSKGEENGVSLHIFLYLVGEKLEQRRKMGSTSHSLITQSFQKWQQNNHSSKYNQFISIILPSIPFFPSIFQLSYRTFLPVLLFFFPLLTLFPSLHFLSFLTHKIKQISLFKLLNLY